jgi:hypothetical protein
VGLDAELDEAAADLVGGDLVDRRVAAQVGLQLAEGVAVVGERVRAEALRFLLEEETYDGL